MLQVIVQGVVGLATFAVLYVAARLALRPGGGDEIKDIGLD